MWILLCVLHHYCAWSVISCDTKGCSITSLIITVINSCIVHWWYACKTRLFLREKLFFIPVEHDFRDLISWKCKYCFTGFLLSDFVSCFDSLDLPEPNNWLSLLHPVLAPRTSTCQAYHHIASIHQHTLAYQWQPVLTSLTPQKMDSRNIPHLEMKWTAGHYMRNQPLLNSQMTNITVLNPSACLLNTIQQKPASPHLQTVLPHAAGKWTVKVQIIPNLSHKLCPLYEK